MLEPLLDQGPKALFIVLTHRKAGKLGRAVEEKRHVAVHPIDAHLSLFMGSAVGTGVETIRSPVRTIYRRLDGTLEILTVLLTLVPTAVLWRDDYLVCIGLRAAW